MGCTVREKHIRTNRRTRSVKPEPDHSASANTNGNVDKSSSGKTCLKPKGYQMGLQALSQSPMTGPSSTFEDNGWGYCTEEQLEEILLKNLEYLYNDAINKLVALGYDEEVALRAILRNGHCYGGMDVLTNILHNSLAYLNSGSTTGADDEPEPSFADLRQLEEYSLASMVCLLQQVKPHLSKGDAMWCLLMSDLHVGRASVMEIPVLPSPGGSTGGGEGAPTGGGGPHEVVVGSGGPVGVAPALCRFHGGWGFGNGGTSEYPANGMSGFLSYASEMALQREIECPKRFNLSPSMKSLLKRNVAMFAAGFRANAKQFHGQSQACMSSLSGGSSSGPLPAGEESQHSKNQEVVNSVMSKFRDLNLDEATEHVALDQKDEMILSLVHQIKDLEKQVKERKEWAHQKAMQAARKLSHDLTELKMLRMEREETQRLKKGKQTLEETTMKRLGDMEGALRMASGQVDRANAAVRKLETENAEIRAEMEASKLSASESVTTCLEVAKREKKCLKKLLAWEKQKAKVQEEIAAEKRRITELERELAQVEEDTKEAEVMLLLPEKVVLVSDIMLLLVNCGDVAVVGILVACSGQIWSSICEQIWGKLHTCTIVPVVHSTEIAYLLSFLGIIAGLSEGSQGWGYHFRVKAKWRQEQKARELALAQVEEEKRLKEVSEANNKRKLEALRLKIEIDFQRHKDDLQRLEQEYARLKESAQSEVENQSINNSWTENVKPAKGGETIARLLHELDQTQEEKSSSCDRDCMICMKDEVSVVFLPCAHQVICASCNEGYGKRGNKAACPYCRVPIEQRIRVYGASS
ncbi:RING/U-box superfamily protein [Striga asiatica]|uniref:RING/U-box superfamily protein n=1 Tax=Striga asiatica TaxID=4170 RepID=A0A5A7Q202_STRAF|nr:RING/U-box superfamily protein [Striga asiatica]